MQIDGTLLMPNMTSTNSAARGSHLVQKEGRFQDELEIAHERLERSSNSIVWTKEQIEQRNKDIRDASIQLEALMLKMLYNDMWKTVPKNELFGDDNAMDIYRDMYHEELTKQMAKGGGIGLADFIYNQLAIPEK